MPSANDCQTRVSWTLPQHPSKAPKQRGTHIDKQEHRHQTIDKELDGMEQGEDKKHGRVRAFVLGVIGDEGGELVLVFEHDLVDCQNERIQSA